jgi:VCBS repeat-containing protein
VANDGSLDSNLATVNITVGAVNDAPVANDDSYSTNEDTVLAVPAAGVMTNDTDVDSPTLTSSLVTQATHGSVVLDADGSLVYTPDADYNGADSFTYQASDGQDDSNIATVNITVNAVNDAPVAADDSYTTAEDTPLSVAAPGVLGNDTDVDSPTILALPVAGAAHGTATLSSDGSFTYTPAVNYHGPDSFTYLAFDGTDASHIATVNITVTSVNDAPVAVDDTYSTNEDTPVTISAPGVLGNDTDADGDSLTAVSLGTAAHGSVVFNADGSFTYTPAANYNGPDSFTYTASDGQAFSNVATVNLTVNSVNDAPVAGSDSYTTAEDTPLTVAAPGVLGNDTDVDSPVLTAAVVANPTHGALTLNADGSFTYTPAANYHGSDSFTYKANDGSLDSNVATVSLTVTSVNDAPVAANDSYTTTQNTALSIVAPGILGNDSDVDGDAMTAHVLSQPSHGGLAINTNGSFVYLPATGWSGTDSFSYVANDGQAFSNVATVSITVTSTNTAPVANNDSYSTSEDTTLSIAAPGVLGNDTDANGDHLTAGNVTQPAHGTVGVNSDGSFTYVPNANYNGPDSFTYQANDGQASSNTATVNLTVNAVNDAPVAANDSYTTAEDTALTVSAPGVLANDTDVDSAVLTAAVVANPAHGSLTLNSNGSFTYTPAANYNGADSFTYRASDGSLTSNVATVNLTVTAVNDAPVAGNDSYTTGQNTALTVSAPGVLGNDTDVDGDTLTAGTVVQPAHGTVAVNANGSFTYTPASGFTGGDSFTYRASDGQALSNVATVSITVTSTNVAPVANNDSYSTNEDTQLAVAAPGVLGNDTDANGDHLTAANVTQPAHGTVGLNSMGSFTYLPNANYNGPDSFTYQANDGTVNSNVATVSITVIAVNDPPTLAPIGNKTVNETSLLTFTAVGSDVDVPAQPLGYSLINGTTSCGSVTSCTVPAGASINASSGVFTWTPTAAQGPGTYRFKVQVSDGLATANEEITITVNDVVATSPKLVITTSAQTANVGVSTGTITVQRQTSTGTAQTTGSLTVSLSSSSSGGAFRNTGDTSTITSVTIASGSSSASFRYRDSLGGTPTITAATAGYTPATQVETIHANKLVFTTSAQSTTTGVSTGTITVQRQTFSGSTLTSGSLTVGLSSSAGTGTFRNSGDTATITSVTIASGSSSVSFRYRDSAAGTPTITAAASGYTAATQTETVTALPVLAFTTAPQTTAPNASTNQITIQRQTPGGVGILTGSLVVNLSTSKSTGMFRNAGDSATITSVTIPAGSSTVSFRYRDSATGSPVITASAGGFVSATQTETVMALSTIVFTTTRQLVAPNAVSGLITIQRQSSSGSGQTSGSLTVQLATSSSGGQFLNSAGSSVITSITIPSGSSSVSFRYRDSTSGTPTVTASATGYVTGTQAQRVDAAPTISGLSSAYTTARNTAKTISFTVGDIDSALSAVTMTGSWSTSTIIGSITFSGTGSSRTMTITPRAGKTGTATIIVTADDGWMTTTKTFTLKIS